MPFDLKKLQELEKAATPGPWGSTQQAVKEKYQQEANAKLLVQARNALPELLALVEAYRLLRWAQMGLDVEERLRNTCASAYLEVKWREARDQRNAAARKVAELEAASLVDG